MANIEVEVKDIIQNEEIDDKSRFEQLTAAGKTLADGNSHPELQDCINYHLGILSIHDSEEKAQQYFRLISENSHYYPLVANQ